MSKTPHRPRAAWACKAPRHEQLDWAFQGEGLDGSFAFSRTVTLLDAIKEFEFDALLGKDALRLLGDFAVSAGQDAVEVFDNRDFRPKTPPDGAEFKTDDTGADDDHLLRHGLERQRAGR